MQRLSLRCHVFKLHVMRTVIQMNTLFALLAKFGDTNIPLEKCCEDYFGIALKKALDYARSNELPVPVYRLGSQKSPWLISADELAAHIDRRMQDARHDWGRLHSCRDKPRR